MEKTAKYGKPEGKDGEQLLNNMDKDHTPVSLWSLTHLNVKEDDITLDIGCGSGLNIKRLFELSPRAKSYGVDYSKTSVKKSTQLNREKVDSGEIEVIEANVLDMPFEDKKFDIITAFETVYFWPDLVNAFTEVQRILKDDGQFFIVMDANGCYTPELLEKTKDENCTFYTDTQLTQYLQEAGYTQITTYIRKRKSDEKIIKKQVNNEYNEEVIKENYSQDNYVEKDENGSINTPEWYCIIACK